MGKLFRHGDSDNISGYLSVEIQRISKGRLLLLHEITPVLGGAARYIKVQLRCK